MQYAFHDQPPDTPIPVEAFVPLRISQPLFQRFPERRRRNAARDFSRVIAAHSISKDGESAIGADRNSILMMRPDQAGVGFCSEFKLGVMDHGVIRRGRWQMRLEGLILF